MIELTSHDVSMILGFMAGLLGTKVVDYLSYRIYYKGKPRKNKSDEKKDGE